MPDDVEFLTAMYGHHEEAEQENEKRDHDGALIPERGIISLPALSQIVRAQAQTIARLGNALANSERQVRKLEGRVRTLYHHVNSMGRSVNSLDREMDSKLDRRDW